MVLTGGFSAIRTGWLAVALLLYAALLVVIVFIYAPTVRRQLREAEHDPNSSAYAVIERRSTLLGIATLVIVLVIVVLMVLKPF